MSGLLVSLLLLTASSTAEVKVNDTSAFLGHLLSAAEEAQDVSPDALSPALTSAQIVKFRVIKNRSFAASYVSSTDHPVWMWNGRGGQGSHRMDLEARDGSVVRVSIDDETVWPKLSNQND